MQDNYIDEQFVDRSWQEMRKLLDKEMPVKKPRRRGLFWLFFLLLPILGGLTYLTWSLTGASSSRERELAGQSFERTSITSSADPGNQSQDAAIPETAADAEIGENIENSERQTAIPETAPAVVPEIRKKEKSVAAGSGMENQGRSPRSIQNAQAAEMPGSRTEAPQYGGEKEQEQQRIAVPVFPPIAVRPYPDLDYAEEYLLPEEVGYRVKKRAAVLPDHWGISGAALTGNGSVLSGVDLGLAAEYRFGHSKWSFGTGLYYQYQTRDFTGKRRGRNQDEALNNSPDVPTSVDPDQQDTSVSGNSGSLQLPPAGSLSARTQGLGIPVMFHFQASRRLGLTAGAEAIYLFRARRSASQQVIPVSNFSSNSYDRKTTGLFNAEAAAAYDGEVFRQFDVNLTGGLFYRISPRLKVHLTYHHGMIDLVKSDHYSSFNRYGSLGATYFLR